MPKAGQPLDTHRRAVNALLAFVAGTGLGLFLTLWFLGETQKSAYYFPGLLLALTVGCIAVNLRLRLGIALTLLAILPLPWMGDWALGWMTQAVENRNREARAAYAHSMGYAFDGRSPRQVVEDLRRKGEDAWPAVHPAVMLQELRGEALLPLAGISNSQTEYGNEDGRYLIYRSDEHGFQNPSGIWSLPSVDIAAVGDSFTHGAAVPAESNLLSAVRSRWPATLNLGYGGNGPLLELATLLEYLPQRKPRVVLWVLCEGNDLGEDLQRELGSSLLQRYWHEARPLQDLERRQAEIDSLLRRHVEEVLHSRQNSPSPRTLRDILGASRLRATLYNVTHLPPDRWDTLSEILQTAQRVVQGWQGRLYLVYLPVHRGMQEGWFRIRQRGQPETRRQRVLDMAEKLDLPVIDLESAFRKDFVYPYPGHFTAPGYLALSRAIRERLESDGL